MGGLFDLNSKKEQLIELEKKVNEPNFWDDIENANKVTIRLNSIKKELMEVEDINNNIALLEEYLSIYDESMEDEVITLLELVNKTINELEINTLLNGEYDESDCYLEIPPAPG